MSQDSVVHALEMMGGIGTAADIIDQLKRNGEIGEVKYSVHKALVALKVNQRIDYTLSTVKCRGSPARIYRVLH